MYDPLVVDEFIEMQLEVVASKSEEYVQEGPHYPVVLTVPSHPA
jgi:hypothetical protein